MLHIQGITVKTLPFVFIDNNIKNKDLLRDMFMLQYAKEGTVKKSFYSYYFLMISPERCRVASRRNLKYLFDKDTKILLVFRYEGAAIPNQIG